MADYNQKLNETLDLLQNDWSVKKYQPAGMGWAAELANNDTIVTLHSERGWVDIYLGQYHQGGKLGCSNQVEEIVKIISNVNT